MVVKVLEHMYIFSLLWGRLIEKYFSSDKATLISLVLRDQAQHGLGPQLRRQLQRFRIAAAWAFALRNYDIRGFFAVVMALFEQGSA
jgi:hypothetical protein